MGKSSTLVLILLAVVVAGLFLVYLSRPAALSRKENLIFSHNARDMADCVSQDEENVAEARWTGNDKMRIQALGRFVNCACSVGSGGYRIDGDKIVLQYEEICHGPKEESCYACEEMVYEIQGLERKDYAFEMEKISY